MKINRLSTLTALPLIIAFAVTQIACGAGFDTVLRLAVAAGAPGITLLEQQNVISADAGGVMIADVSAEALAVADMASCFNAIPKGDLQSKPKHLECVRTLERAPSTLKLLSDFSKYPEVQKIADDISAVVQGAEIYYGGVPKASARRSGVALPTTEKALKARIKILRRDLGQQ